ncbi:homocysteine S-methyltransferase [Croceicoccus ponticola]|uniref:Homocysteine S-methyltransferase n=1 Tax=Croceicoccus ponticola TaxID=2217664 RepID=A0A437H0T3_9SPHN|nr:homocysteine S-methyltransferase family protein [Croceicoccus ponticola]RVQ69218.1 homocysteine S-methyltransferase [Croceicoccus ponticola]
MSQFDRLMEAKRPYLTDGGLETWLFFQQGFTAPEFAAIALIEDEAARAALRRYFDGFLELAQTAGTGFVLDTVTWRGSPVWAEAIGQTEEGALALNREAAAFTGAIRDEWRDRVPDVVINGVIGPAGDGYAPGRVPTADEALALHRAQVSELARAGVDMISAITMTNVAEAIGIARAAQEVGLPVAISFTVETDGSLPTGDTLADAIAATDAATGAAMQGASAYCPAYYMVNCAHPDHFRAVIATGAAWIVRLGGLRANASRMSHAELDNAKDLDDGDPVEFGELHRALAATLPNLRVVGGCCGTDHRHVACVSHELHGVPG